MSEFSYFSDRLAAQQINERIQLTRRSQIPGRRRRHANRHVLAERLHSIADRIDG